MIIAGIVTFEPDIDRLRQNLAAISPQVSEVVVYDNGSHNGDEVSKLVAATSNATVILGDRNNGIAAALNRLAETAVTRGAKYLVTLDQDSVCSETMVANLAAVMGHRIGMVTPYIVDRNKMSMEEFHLLSLPELERYSQPARKGAITSGALLDLQAWKSVGGFDELFFIDYVDYDFNQRLMDAGYSIWRANRTPLLHEVGRATPTWLHVPRKDISGNWHIERFFSFGHSPTRCYYKARNRILFTRKYGRKLGLTHEGAWQIPQQIALTILFEKDKITKLKGFIRGIRDGIREPLTQESTGLRGNAGAR